MLEGYEVIDSEIESMEVKNNRQNSVRAMQVCSLTLTRSDAPGKSSLYRHGL
jgi:hypothetical protein